MKDSKEGVKCISSVALELMVMVEFKAFDNNQCLVDWFKTQVKTIRLEQSTIVIAGGARLDIQTLVCLL
jgi:hypothetical protein